MKQYETLIEISIETLQYEALNIQPVLLKPGISPPAVPLSVRGPLDALLGTGSRRASKPQHSWGRPMFETA